MQHSHSTLEDFYEALEPTPNPERDELSDAVGEIIKSVMARNLYAGADNQRLADSLLSSFRNWVAMVYVLRPDLLPQVQGWRIAEALGCTRQAFSRLCVRWSDKLGGMRNPSMKTQNARANYSTSCNSVGSTLPKRRAQGIGQRTDNEMRSLQEALIESAMADFINNVVWDRIARRALFQAELIDSADQLTQLGLARLEAVRLTL